MKTLLFQITLFLVLLVPGIAQDQPGEKQTEAERTAVESDLTEILYQFQ